MTEERLNKELAATTDEWLADRCETIIGESASRYGLKMSIPPSPNDEDMLLGELVRRFKILTPDSGTK